MGIEVKLFSNLREDKRKKVFFEFEEGINVFRIIRILDVKEEDVEILLINGRYGEIDIELNDGDTISIFPPIGGN